MSQSWGSGLVVMTRMVMTRKVMTRNEQSPGFQSRQGWEVLSDPRVCLLTLRLPGPLTSPREALWTDLHGAETICETPISRSLPCSVGCPDICLPTRPKAFRLWATEEQPWRTDVAVLLRGPRPSLLTIGG